MSKELIPGLNEAQQRIISGKTPPKYIKTRPGRGGLNLSYVEVGYVIEQLNKAFNLAWDWEIEDQQVGKKHIWVRGRLTIYFSPEFKVTKSAYGGAVIKTDKYNGEVIDIGDDLKAASADALKKAASMIGIASDVYFPQMEGFSEVVDTVSEEKDSEAEEAETILSAFKCNCGSKGKYHKVGCPAREEEKREEIKQEEVVGDLPF